MNESTGEFRISFSGTSEVRSFSQERILLGRLDTCDVVLDDPTVSRIHAGITFQDERYVLANLSKANILTINGRRLASEETDVLTDGDTIQIGPFAILVGGVDDKISLSIQYAASRPAMPVGEDTSAPPDAAISQPGLDNVVNVFWEKRTREKEDWGTRLRPRGKPRPGKAMFNWRPTGDLRRPWRIGLFVWAILLVGAVGAVGFYKYPTAFEPEPLTSAHSMTFETTGIAAMSNGNSCTTCHTPNEPIENSCVRCHTATDFHSSNTEAHETAGVTCTVCHQEHRGPTADLKAQAIRSCAECHNDNNHASYNGHTVRTPHQGSYGYPVVDGVWKWKGVYTEVAAAIPEIGNSATGDPDEQSKLSRQFHTIHVARLKAPTGFAADSRGLVTCSTCHDSFNPIDRVKPRQTCAACHTTSEGSASRDARFASGSVNCISCHVQHPFSTGRWSEFLTDDAAERRRTAVVAHIKELSPQ